MQIRGGIRVILIAMIGLVAVVVAVEAQSNVLVDIRVTDRSKQELADATLRISPLPAGVSDLIRTDVHGQATVALPPGEYTVRAAAPGMITMELKGIRIDKAVTVSMPMKSLGSESLGPWVLNPSSENEPGKNHGAQSPGQLGAEKADVLTLVAGRNERGTYTLAALKDLPHVTVTIFDHHTNAQETYSGVALIDLLAKLGVPHGATLRSKALADYVMATGSDGYKSVVALAEIDPEFHPGQVIVADAMDGKALGPTGPFRLIVSEDKRPARSVRNLISLEVKTAQ